MIDKFGTEEDNDHHRETDHPEPETQVDKGFGRMFVWNKQTEKEHRNRSQNDEWKSHEFPVLLTIQRTGNRQAFVSINGIIS